ncbi:MAG: terminase large subunit domain-containing protein [Candidatus Bathyarchaeia archaeon]
MSSSRSKLNRLIRKGKKTLREAQQRSRHASVAKPDAVPFDPIKFATEWLGFQPTPYQAELLTDASKRIVVVFPRQSGKTTTLAIRMIHFALTNPNTTSLIVAPGLRQSMIVMDRIQEQILHISPQRRRERFRQIKRTTISFKNGSTLVALPCSADRLRGYTANLLVADEISFFADDQTVFYNILFPMLQTTDGTLIASSTPWGKDSVFYSFTQDSTFKVHRITIDAVINAGLTTRKFIEEMERRTPAERYRREYLAEFVDDELSYFPQKLITQCIDSNLTPLTDDWTKNIKAKIGRYFVGVDFGKHNDHSAIAIVQLDQGIVKLTGMVRFPLETPYASVIGYVKIICDKLNRVEKTLCDQTGVGEYIVEDMKQARIRSTIEGITLTLPSKQEMLSHMKQLMQTKGLALYYDADLIAEINVETFELTKTGQIQFNHPTGTHDDQLWSLALAVYATRTLDTSFMTEGYGVPSNF